MPAISKRQQRFMGAELSRKRAGKRTVTGMTEAQLEEHASIKNRRIPERKGTVRKGR